MSSSTPTLIRALARDLPAVTPLPSLRRVALGVGSLSLAAIAVATALSSLAGLLELGAPSLRAATALALHVVLATGALLVALGSCVPGRDRLETVGLVLAAVGGGALAGIGLVMAQIGSAGVVSLSWAVDVGVCSVLVLLPALVPAVLLARFAVAGAPLRPTYTLMFAAGGSVSLAAVPVYWGCPIADPLHGVAAHYTLPAVAAVVLGAALVILFRRERDPRKAPARLRSAERS